MNKQEALKKLEGISRPGCTRWVVYDDVKELIEQIDEPEKPVVPQFVAEHIEYHKNMNSLMGDIFNRHFIDDKRVEVWLREALNAYDNLGKAWLFGYEVEKEKMYTAKLKIIAISYVNYINRRSADGAIILGDLNAASGNYQTSFTQSELEELNVWDNPAFEIEEISNE